MESVSTLVMLFRKRRTPWNGAINNWWRNVVNSTVHNTVLGKIKRQNARAQVNWWLREYVTWGYLMQSFFYPFVKFYLGIHHCLSLFCKDQTSSKKLYFVVLWISDVSVALEISNSSSIQFKINTYIYINICLFTKKKTLKCQRLFFTPAEIRLFFSFGLE